MTEINATTPFARLAVAAGIAGTATLFSIVPAGAVPAPDFNPSCADLAPAGETWTEFKIDSDPADGSVEIVPGVSVNLSHPDPATVAFTSTVPVAAFVVKGGPAATVEIYTPSVTGESATSPMNPNNGQPYGISHVTFCFPEVEEPPADDPPADVPPAEEPPAEQPPAEQPPAEQPPAEDPPAVTPATATPKVEVLGAQQVAAPARALARTGVTTGPLGLAGALLAGLGSALVRRSRRMAR